MTPEEVRQEVRRLERAEATRWALAAILFGIVVGLPLWGLWIWTSRMDSVIGELAFTAVQIVAFFSAITLPLFRWLVSRCLGDK